MSQNLERYQKRLDEVNAWRLMCDHALAILASIDPDSDRFSESPASAAMKLIGEQIAFFERKKARLEFLIEEEKQREQRIRSGD